MEFSRELKKAKVFGLIFFGFALKYSFLVCRKKTECKIRLMQLQSILSSFLCKFLMESRGKQKFADDSG